MSELLVTSIYNQEGEGAPSFPKGATVTGVITATSFSGSGANLTGIDATALKDGSGNVKIQANSTGAVVTGILTVSSSVSVGGTLTYEDVTNIDSVGVITARSGIVATGVVTATSYRGEGSQISGIEAAPTIQAVASGAIAANKAVKVNSDGTISVPTVTPASFGSIGDVGYTFNTSGHKLTSHYNPITKKLVVVYVRSNFPKAMVGTVSGSTITWGSETQITSGAWDVRTLGDLVYDPILEKYLMTMVQLPDNGNEQVRYATFTISGNEVIYTNATQGSLVNQQNCTNLRAVLVGNSKVCVVWGGGNNYVYQMTGDIQTNGSVSWNTGNIATVSGNGGNNTLGLVYDSDASKLVVLYTDTSSLYCNYRVNAVSGNGISQGTVRTIFTSNYTGQQQLAYHPIGSGSGAGRYIVFCHIGAGTNGATNNGLHYAVGSLSGDEITWSSVTEVTNGYTTMPPEIETAYNTARKKTVFVYKDGSNVAQLQEIAVTDGTTNSSLSSATEIVNNSVKELNISYDSDTQKDVVLYAQADNVGKYRIRSGESSTANSGNFIGFTGADSYTNGQTATVKVVGNVSTQSGLTPGQQYYLQNDGTLGLTAVENNSIEAGKALTATSLLIKG